jgi:hypothetical protein
MLKVNRRTFTQFNLESAFCFATSLSVCFVTSAHAASFSGTFSTELLFPSPLPNGVTFTIGRKSTDMFISRSGSGTENAFGAAGINGSTDSTDPGTAILVNGYNFGPMGENRTNSTFSIPYTINYKYNISSSVSGSGLDQSSIEVRSDSTQPIFPTDSVTGNESKEKSGTINGILTAAPLGLPDFRDSYNVTFSGRANTAVPAPSSALSTLAFGAVSAGYLLKRQLKKQKSASGNKSVV